MPFYRQRFSDTDSRGQIGKDVKLLKDSVEVLAEDEVVGVNSQGG